MIALFQVMPNLLVAPLPEDDDSNIPLVHPFGPSPFSKEDEHDPATDLEKVRFKFDPRKVGFGIVAPWPDPSQTHELNKVVVTRVATDEEDKDKNEEQK